MRRILTAAILVPVLWCVIKLAPPWAFFLLVAVSTALCAWECYALLERRGARPFRALGTAACIAVTWSFFGAWRSFDGSVPIVGVTILATVAAMALRDEVTEMLDASWSTVFPVVFVGLTLAFPMKLRMLPEEERGRDLLILLLVCTAFADTAAYYVGSAWGRRRMAPAVSPKKSWEGAAGGILASLGGGLLAHFWFYRHLPLGHAAILGVLLGASGILGDLAESMVKRAAGAKDSSGLLPGHGGLLDRADSLLFSGPVLYYYYRLFLEGAS
jgi:phosphatidate cytidylyltransferase